MLTNCPKLQASPTVPSTLPRSPQHAGHLLSAALAAATQTEWGKKSIYWVNTLLLSLSVALLLHRGPQGLLSPSRPQAAGPVCAEVHVTNVRTCMWYRRNINADRRRISFCWSAWCELYGALTEQGATCTCDCVHFVCAGCVFPGLCWQAAALQDP